MKILMVIDGIGKGGKERRMLELIKGLTRNPGEFEIYLISLTNVVEYKYVYELPVTFKILERRYRKDFLIVFKLRKIIKSFKPDIIHSWSTMSSVYLSMANLFTKIPFINGVVADAPLRLNMSDKHYFRLKLTTPFSDAFVSNSFAGIKSYKIPRKKSVCIYNGIDLNRFKNLKPSVAAEEEILKAPKNGQFILAMVATFNNQKDYSTLLNVAAQMCPGNKNLVFLLIGEGPTRENLMALVPPELLHKQIIFTGKREDIESLLQFADVGMLITNADKHGEGISNSIIEYMISGLPVIATRGGGTAEIVKDGVNGFLVETGDAGSIIQKINLLKNNKDLVSEMGKNAINWANEMFNLQNQTIEYINLYDRLKNKKEFK